MIFPGTGHPPGVGIGSSVPNTYGSNTGFGRVIYPGTGHPPAVGNPLSITDPTFASRLGATVGGFSTQFGEGHGYRRFRQPLVVPYAVPVYIGAYPDYGYADQQPMMPQQQAPQVIINQNVAPDVARPVVREYVPDASGGIRIYGPQSQAAETPAPVADESPTFLIAFKDHTIYAALAYWVEGDTLHYVTNQNTHNQVSLDLVDRELSDRLNRERQVDFRLPPRK